MIIGIASGKGGVGKSTIAANLAYWYSLKEKVLLVDLDFGMSNLHLFYNVYPRYSLYNHFYNDASWDSLKHKISDNLDLIYSGQGNQEIADITKEQRSSVINFINSQKLLYKYIIIDLGPGIHSSITDLLNVCDRSVVVIDFDRSSLTDGYQLIKLLVTARTTGVCVLVNKSNSIEKAYGYFQGINQTLKKHAKKKVAFLGVLDYTGNVERAYTDRVLFLEKYSKTREGKQLIEVGEELKRNL